jgi:hypothetical protein
MTHGGRRKERRLPNAELACVDEEKVTAYLLNPGHQRGASKARFFAHFGFTRQQWGALAEAIRLHAQVNPVEQVVESEFGARYTVIGPLDTPSGRRPMVVTVWVIEGQSGGPRLVTAYPAKKVNDDQGT